MCIRDSEWIGCYSCAGGDRCEWCEPQTAVYGALGGLGLLGLLVAARIGLGVHATSLHDAYVADSGSETNLALREEGLLYRDLTNGAIAVAVGGLVLLAVDVIWALTRLE